MEIIQERLEREFNMTVITVPNVSYHAFKKNPDTVLIVNNPSDLPEPSRLDHVEEPFIKATIITKSDYVGNVMSLCIENVAITNQTYLTTERVELTFDMPLAEIV
jgi:GTP-binding protein LepA